MNVPLNLNALKEKVRAEEGATQTLPPETISPDAIPDPKKVIAALDPTGGVPGGEPLPRLYKCSQRSMKVHTTSGREIVFAGGKFYTTDLELINYLDDQLKRGGLPTVAIDANEPYYDAANYDVVAKIRREVRAQMEVEFEKRLAEVTNPNRNMGNSVQGQLKTASTKDVAAVAAGAGPTTIPMLNVGTKPA